MNDALLQAPLPNQLVGILGVEPLSTAKRASFTSSFLRRSVQPSDRHQLDELLARKAVVMDYHQPKMEKKKVGRRAAGLSAKERRLHRVFDLQEQHQRYKLFLPLHHLWKQYVHQLCSGLRPSSNPQSVQQKLLKADLHGAEITVVRSRCPSYVGIRGIVIQELKHVFKVITKDDKVKVLPKRSSVFSVETGSFVSYIYGSRFQQRAAERSAKKFKVHGTIDL